MGMTEMSFFFFARTILGLVEQWMLRKVGLGLYRGLVDFWNFFNSRHCGPTFKIVVLLVGKIKYQVEHANKDFCFKFYHYYYYYTTNTVIIPTHDSILLPFFWVWAKNVKWD